ncbi:MAG: CvpA family protein [Acidobacteriota bacterium]|nr:CvpA family protein [Acidobacteriota bacterium]
MTGALAGWNWLDWLLAAIVVLSTVRALMRGLVQALFALAGIVCGFLLAGMEHGSAAAWAMRQGWFAAADVASVVCYAAILVGVVIVFAIAGSVAKRMAHAAGLGMVDRLLGGVLGAARGVLLGVAVVLMMKAVVPSAEVLVRSRLSSYFLAAGHAVSFVVPHTLR